MMFGKSQPKGAYEIESGIIENREVVGFAPSQKTIGGCPVATEQFLLGGSGGRSMYS